MARDFYKMSYTQRVGECGVIGVRNVRKGGRIKISSTWFCNEKLLPYVGKEIYFHDYCGEEIEVCECYYNNLFNLKRNKPSRGKIIVVI